MKNHNKGLDCPRAPESKPRKVRPRERKPATRPAMRNAVTITRPRTARRQPRNGNDRIAPANLDERQPRRASRHVRAAEHRPKEKATRDKPRQPERAIHKVRCFYQTPNHAKPWPTVSTGRSAPANASATAEGPIDTARPHTATATPREANQNRESIATGRGHPSRSHRDQLGRPNRAQRHGPIRRCHAEPIPSARAADNRHNWRPRDDSQSTNWQRRSRRRQVVSR